jgi:hypothetical protein
VMAAIIAAAGDVADAARAEEAGMICLLSA